MGRVHTENDESLFHTWGWACCRSERRAKALERLGRKINYLSLYQYCHQVDRHEKDMQLLKSEMKELKEQNAMFKELISQQAK